MTVRPAVPGDPVWVDANRAYLMAGVAEVRARLERRILWLRELWRSDPLAEHRALVISDERADVLLREEGPEAEGRFYRTDAGAVRAGKALAWAAEQRALHRVAARKVVADPALETLAERFGLTEFARDVLMLAVAPTLDPALEALYAYAQDDVTKRHATLRLALALLDPADRGRATGRADLLPASPLRRFGLLALDEGGAKADDAPLHVAERVHSFLLGIDTVDPTAMEMLRMLPGPPVARGHRDALARLVGVLSGGSVVPPQWSLNLIGPRGSGRRAVGVALCDALGLGLAELDVAGGAPDELNHPRTVRTLVREAHLGALGLLADGDGASVADPGTTVQLQRLIDRLPVPVVVVSERIWGGGRDFVRFRLPPLTSADKTGVWEAVLRDAKVRLNGRLGELTQQFDLGPSQIVQVVRDARDRARLNGRGSASPTFSGVWAACRDRSGESLEELSQRIEPCHDWEDLVLPADAIRQLREIVDQVGHRTTVYERWGFGRKLSRGRGISVLFSGPSGTGKTLAAEILAGQLDLALHRIDLSGVVSKYIGETEKNLRRAFDAAEQAGAVLFFDEADALFGKRSEVKDSHDRYANIEINYLLQRMEDYRGLVILATNMKAFLDPAFLRRLRFLVEFPFPDADERQRIWRRVFPAEVETEELDFGALARLGIPGGNIKNIALNAAFLAAGEGSPVSMPHVYHAARREYAKIEKLVLEAEFGTGFGRAAQ